MTNSKTRFSPTFHPRSGPFSTRLDPFEHRLRLRLEKLAGSARLEAEAPVLALVACSGGRDSTALLAAAAAAASRLPGLQVAAAYVHHGPHSDPVVDRARTAAREAVKATAKSFGTRFFEAEREAAPSALRSEAALRAYRLSCLRALARAAGAAGVLIAHHADDLLETRLIRLIRGTSLAGVEAMRERRGLWWRPLLAEPGFEVDAYARRKNLSWLDDPSNESDQPLRNWIRLRWLPSLEGKRPGAARALARSLEAIARESAEADDGALDELVEDLGLAYGTAARPSAEFAIARRLYLRLSPFEQSRLLARLMKQAGAKYVTSSRIAEAQKRLGSPQKAFSFTVGGLCWRINAERIQAKLSGCGLLQPEALATSSVTEGEFERSDANKARNRKPR